jgi:hypothetical protein
MKKIHTYCSYNNMKTYIISKKRTEKNRKEREKNFKWVFELEDEGFLP